MTFVDFGPINELNCSLNIKIMPSDGNFWALMTNIGFSTVD